MKFTALLVDKFKPIKISDTIILSCSECEQGFFIPLGWEEELSKRNITFEVREDLSIKEITL